MPPQMIKLVSFSRQLYVSVEARETDAKKRFQYCPVAGNTADPLGLQEVSHRLASPPMPVGQGLRPYPALSGNVSIRERPNVLAHLLMRQKRGY